MPIKFLVLGFFEGNFIFVGVGNFLRKARFFVRFPNAWFSRERGESARISESLRFRSVRPLSLSS